MTYQKHSALGALILLLAFLSLLATAEQPTVPRAVMGATPRIPAGFVLVPAGNFLMGSPTSELGRYVDEDPQHPVVISRPFYMSETVITQEEWVAVMETNRSRYKDDTLPVDHVSWFDAIEYCNRRSALEGLTPAYTRVKNTVTWHHDATGYRLPTEAEWEYAARAGTDTPFSTGDNITRAQANYDGNYPYVGIVKEGNLKKTVPVKTYAPNPWGLYEMHGNVWEWCWDWYGYYPRGLKEAVVDPVNNKAVNYRVYRGGSWTSSAANLRSANRSNKGSYTPSTRNNYIGFRIVLPVAEGAFARVADPAQEEEPVIVANILVPEASPAVAQQKPDPQPGTVTEAEAETPVVEKPQEQHEPVIAAGTSAGVPPYAAPEAEPETAKGTPAPVTPPADRVPEIEPAPVTIVQAEPQPKAEPAPVNDKPGVSLEPVPTETAKAPPSTPAAGGAETRPAQEPPVVVAEAEPVAPVKEVPAKPVIPDFVLITPGSFLMGSPKSELGRYDDEGPQHLVTISRPFYIGTTEVTQKEWAAVMTTNPSIFKGEDLPVENVSWFEAIEYCNRRSRKEGLTLVYTRNGDMVICDWTANGYRLPTEAEWEYAARGGAESKGYSIYSGSHSVGDVAWYLGNSEYTSHPVASKRANVLGIYDMSGNVWEWCWDWYASYTVEPQIDPNYAVAGLYRVLRGGGWNELAGGVRSATRGGNTPNIRGDGGTIGGGFRLVHSAD